MATVDDKKIIFSMVGVSKTIQQNQKQVLKNIYLSFFYGAKIGIIGLNGAGKSTLMHIIGCIDDFESGTYILNGEDISSIKEGKRAKIRNKDIGIVMQDFALVEDYTAIENVMIPLYFAKGKLLESKKSIAKKALEKVGIGELASKRVNKLSGGQKQRVSIARAFLKNPSILILDEATSALDNATQAAVCEGLENLHVTRVAIAHRLSTIMHCDRIFVMDDGKIVEEGTYDQLMEKQGLFYRLANRQMI